MNPKDHPNGYVGLSTGLIAAFLLTELHDRLGVNLSVDEQKVAQAVLVAAFLFAGRWLGKRA